MIKKTTFFLLALLPIFSQNSWAVFDEEDEIEEKNEIADFKEGNLYYRFIDESQTSVAVSPRYEEEEEDVPGYDAETAPKGKITIPATVIYKGKTYPVTAIDDKTFEYCKEITEILLPQSITSIGTSAFSHTGISTLLLPQQLKTLGSYAFSKCLQLSEISIPNSITNLNSSLFHGCSNLHKVEVPNAVTTIEYGVFGNCSSLEEITLPETLTQIDRHVFKGCDNLQRITCLFSNPNQLKYLGIYGEIFEGTPVNSMILFVPKGCKAEFEKVYPWNKKFKEIRESEITGVATVTTEELHILRTEKGISFSLSQATPIRVYDLTGQLRLQTIHPAGQHTLALPGGTYIVKLGTKSTKLTVN